MYRVQKIVLDKEKYTDLISYADSVSMLSRALYNASLFRIRQVFTGWDKDVRTANEQAVFDELELLRKAYPEMKIRRVLTYTNLEKLMRVTENPDFFAEGLSAQTAQNCVRQAVQDFKNWLSSLKTWKENPESFTGKPNMPGYKRPGTKVTPTFTNQDCVLKKTGKGYSLKFPLTKTAPEVWGKNGVPGKLAEVKFVPFYDTWILSLTYDVPSVTADGRNPYMAGIDFGVRNTVAMALNDSYGLICRGGILNSEIRLYCKKKAELDSAMMEQYGKHVDTEEYRGLLKRHSCRMNDMLHKLSRLIVDTCTEHRVGILVIGHTKYWKQEACMGKKNNQLFELVPLDRLRNMVTYKAEAAGITVLEQEESYTSKSDFLMDDYIPVYGGEKKKPVFSGRRDRGLYRSGTGEVLNADMNGAANILRKACPDAFDDTGDFGFLKSPEVADMARVYTRIPVKRIAAV